MYTYIGSIAKSNKIFWTHVRDIRDGVERDYAFDRCLIKEDAPRPSKVCMALYKMQPTTKNRGLAKNIESSIHVNVDCFVQFQILESISF